MDEREAIRCKTSGKLLGYISCSERKLFLLCKFHHVEESIDLQPYIDRMLAQVGKVEVQDEDQIGIRLLRIVP